MRANNSMPAPMNTSDGISVRFAPKRIVMRPEKPIDSTPITSVLGRNARPTWSGS